MKKNSYLSGALFLVMSLLVCSTVNVNYDYDTGYDFTQLKTFGFLPVPADAGLDQLNAQRIGDAITKELTEKGYTLSKDADFGVAMHFGKQTQTDIQSWGYGYGRMGAWGPGAGNVSVTQYDEGTLIVDFIDMDKKALVWRGSGSGAVDDNANTEKRTQMINATVAKILTNFPPEGKTN